MCNTIEKQQKPVTSCGNRRFHVYAGICKISVFRIVYPFPEGRVDVILILELDVEMIFRDQAAVVHSIVNSFTGAFFHEFICFFSGYKHLEGSAAVVFLGNIQRNLGLGFFRFHSCSVNTGGAGICRRFRLYIFYQIVFCRATSFINSTRNINRNVLA